MIFLQADEALQLLAVFPGAVQTVYDVSPGLLPDEEHPEHLGLTLTTEVGRLAPRPPVELQFAAFRAHKLQGDHHLPHTSQQSVLHGLKQFGLGHSHVLGNVPGEINHGDLRLVALQLVPLVPLHRHVVLLVGERPHVPLDVVAPALGLNPVDAARVDPDEIPGSLEEPEIIREVRAGVRQQGYFYLYTGISASIRSFMFGHQLPRR